MHSKAYQNDSFSFGITEELSWLSGTRGTWTDWLPESEIQKQNLWRFSVFRRGFTRCNAVKCRWLFGETANTGVSRQSGSFNQNDLLSKISRV